MNNSSSFPFLIYGCTGYTGKLITKMAAEQGLKPLIAGRNEEKTKAIAELYGFKYVVFSLDETDKLEQALAQVPVVIHCAGPFIYTWEPMLKACLKTQTHYLDITGEIPVFETLAMFDKKAKEAEIMVLPGVGFDVVPTDCLALYLKDKMPDATHLTLGLMSLGGGLSHGTAKTMVEHLHQGNAIRKEGVITPIPSGQRKRTMDFGRGEKEVIGMPWGDVSTAWYTTGIPNIEVYFKLPSGAGFGMKLSNLFSGLLKSRWFKDFLIKRIEKGPAGPNDQELKTGQSIIFGEVRNEAQKTSIARLTCPQGYKLTAMTALALAKMTVNGTPPSGFQTPAGAFGYDWITKLGDIEIIDIL